MFKCYLCISSINNINRFPSKYEFRFVEYHVPMQWSAYCHIELQMEELKCINQMLPGEHLAEVKEMRLTKHKCV